MIVATGAGGMTGSHLTSVFSSTELIRTDLRESDGIERMDVRDLSDVCRVMERVRAGRALEALEKARPHARPVPGK